MKTNKLGQVLKSFVEISFKVTKKDIEEAKKDPRNSPKLRAKMKNRDQVVGLSSITCPAALAAKRFVKSKKLAVITAVTVMPSYLLVLVGERIYKYDWDYATVDKIADLDSDLEVEPFTAEATLCDEYNLAI